MPNKNELLKDIAVALGATVDKNANDTNELLALIRDNIQGGGSGSAKLYKHYIGLSFKCNMDASEAFDVFFTIYNNSDAPITKFKEVPMGVIDNTTPSQSTYESYECTVKLPSSDNPTNRYPGTFSIGYEDSFCYAPGIDVHYMDSNGCNRKQVVPEEMCNIYKYSVLSDVVTEM